MGQCGSHSFDDVDGNGNRNGDVVDMRPLGLRALDPSPQGPPPVPPRVGERRNSISVPKDGERGSVSVSVPVPLSREQSVAASSPHTPNSAKRSPARSSTPTHNATSALGSPATRRSSPVTRLPSPSPTPSGPLPSPLTLVGQNGEGSTTPRAPSHSHSSSPSAPRAPPLTLVLQNGEGSTTPLAPSHSHSPSPSAPNGTERNMEPASPYMRPSPGSAGTTPRRFWRNGNLEKTVPLMVKSAVGAPSDSAISTASPRTERRIARFLPMLTSSKSRDSMGGAVTPRTGSKHSGIAASILLKAAEQAHRTRRNSEKEAGEEGAEEEKVVLDKRFGYQKNVGSKYELEQEIGRGHFGHTCIAKVKKGERKGMPVAVKVIPKAKMTTAVAIDDVKREVRILKALGGHEYVVKFYDAFEDPLNVYICMELCDGGELLERILQRGGRYSEKDAVTVIRQVLSIVAFCHQQGVVHRDLKPENFLFASKDDASAIRAIDFGLSDFIRPDQRLNDIVGSAYYIAPEVLHRAYSLEADLWSVGVIAYIVLCGSRPFWARSESGIFRAVLRLEPNFADLPWPHISEAAKDFVNRLLSKDLRKRPTAAQALTHPWVRGGGAGVPLDPVVYRNVRTFLRYSELRKAALRALVTTLTEDELIYLRAQFAHIDTDVDGIVNYDDFKKALENVATEAMRESNGLDILRLMDQRKLKSMDFDEFCAAVISIFQLEALSNWPERARIAYESFNESGNRVFVAADLAKEMGSQEPLPTSAVLDEWTNGDGTLSFLGFTRLVHGPSRSRARGRGGSKSEQKGEGNQAAAGGEGGGGEGGGGGGEGSKQSQSEGERGPNSLKTEGESAPNVSGSGEKKEPDSEISVNEDTKEPVSEISVNEVTAEPILEISVNEEAKEPVMEIIEFAEEGIEGGEKDVGREGGEKWEGEVSKDGELGGFVGATEGAEKEKEKEKEKEMQEWANKVWEKGDSVPLSEIKETVEQNGTERHVTRASLQSRSERLEMPKTGLTVKLARSHKSGVWVTAI